MEEQIIPKKPMGKARNNEKKQTATVAIPKIIQTIPKVFRLFSILYFVQIYCFLMCSIQL